MVREIVMAERPILFCNIGWMARYEGLRHKPDKIVGGGDWVRKNRKGHEVCNFLKCADGYAYGHVETIKGSIDRKIRIDALGATPDARFIDGVNVFWTATDPDSGGRYVVGWYRNGRVFRERQHFDILPSSQHQKDGLNSFVVRAKAKDVVRIPIEQRNVRLKSGQGWMGHAQWWFPQEHASRTVEVKKFLRELIPLLEGDLDDSAEVVEIKSAKNLSSTQRKALLDARIGQGQFRKSLIGEWKGCAVLGCKISQLLRASHIKPWKVSNNRERLDRNNGLLLLASLDAAFECGLISFDDSGGILISSKLAPKDQHSLGITEGAKLRTPPSTSRQSYLQYHRTERFQP
jgi:HNH endonuclease